MYAVLSPLTLPAHPRDGQRTLPCGGGQVADVEGRCEDSDHPEASESESDVVVGVGRVQVDIPSGGVRLQKFLTTKTNRELDFKQSLIRPECIHK